MASSITSASRRLCRYLLSTAKPLQISKRCCTDLSAPEDIDSNNSEPGEDRNSASPSSSSANDSNRRRLFFETPLENGLDVGVYKAILVGQVGQSPVQKQLRNGRSITFLSLGTGGIRNNRRPLDDENPREYANRCAIQWHRVAVYPDRLGSLAMKHVKPGSILYLEGNLETKVFVDPISGLVRRVREIAIRLDGRLVFLGKDGDSEQPKKELKGVGYY